MDVGRLKKVLNTIIDMTRLNHFDWWLMPKIKNQPQGYQLNLARWWLRFQNQQIANGERLTLTIEKYNTRGTIVICSIDYPELAKVMVKLRNAVANYLLIVKSRNGFGAETMEQLDASLKLLLTENLE